MIIQGEDLALLVRALRGHQDAIDFVQHIVDVLHCWDDLKDKDKPLTQEQIDHCFWLILVVLPRNSFYQANFSDLNPIVVNSIMNWHAANELEASASETDKEISFIVRSSYMDIVTTCVTIIGGYDWAREIIPTIRRQLHRHEDYRAYRSSLLKQAADAASLHPGLSQLPSAILPPIDSGCFDAIKAAYKIDAAQGAAGE
jgi:hypothetical protein